MRDGLLPPYPGVRSEIELQSELNDACVGCGQDLTEAARFTRNVRRTEIGVIERIEQFRAELEITPFTEMEILRQGEVKVHQAWPTHDPDASGAEGTLRGGRKRRDIEWGKCACIEPAPECALGFRQDRIADEIRTCQPFAPQAEHARIGQRRGQTEAAL